MNKERNSEYKKVCDANNLMKAAKKCMDGVTWKYSTQNYYLNRIDRVRVTKQRLEKMDRMSDGFIVFYVNERGKLRKIRSIHINERVIHRCINDEVLMPNLRPKLIYDNYSSLKGRGTQMAFERLKRDLEVEYRKYRDNNSYILLGDLHAYFESINHECVYQDYTDIFVIDNPKILYLLMDFIDAFGEDSLGLGSQVSQITAVYYPNKIDHVIQEQLKIDEYGRYMDDFRLINRDKDYLIYCLEKIRSMYGERGIELNERKTVIQPISRDFKWLKAKVHVTDTGKVIMRPDHNTIVRERRKLKKFKEKLEDGEMSYKDIEQQYKSWRGHMEYFNSHETLRNLDALYDELFIKGWKEQSNGCKKQKPDYGYVDVRGRCNPAERRHGIELSEEWD